MIDRSRKGNFEGDERKRRRIKGEKMHMPVGRNRGKAPIYYMPKYVESHREGEGEKGKEEEVEEKMMGTSHWRLMT